MTQAEAPTRPVAAGPSAPPPCTMPRSAAIAKAKRAEDSGVDASHEAVPRHAVKLAAIPVILNGRFAAADGCHSLSVGVGCRGPVETFSLNRLLCLLVTMLMRSGVISPFSGNAGRTLELLAAGATLARSASANRSRHCGCIATRRRATPAGRCARPPITSPDRRPRGPQRRSACPGTAGTPGRAVA